MRTLRFKFILRAVSILISITVIAAIFNIFNKINMVEDNLYESIADHTELFTTSLVSETNSLIREVTFAKNDLKEVCLNSGAVKMGQPVPIEDSHINQLYFGNTPMVKNYSSVDKILKKYDITATIFAKTGNDFVRITTNVMKEGKRAIGTKLKTESAAYAAVSNGEIFEGIVDLFDSKYYTIYEPIKNENGQIIGIWYAGKKINFII